MFFVFIGDSGSYCGSDLDNEKLWACHMCTFENHNELRNCEICETERMHTKTPK